MSTADERLPSLCDSAESSSRADQIRQRVAVLSDSFRALFLEWFARLGAQDFDEGDAAAILDAAVAELAGLQARYRGGGITEAGLAYGREQIRDLLERVIRQHAVAVTTKRQIRHLITDLPALGNGWPAPPDDPWNERLIHANLACMWANFHTAGARRLVLCRVLEARSLLRHIETAVPGARIIVARLRARLELLHSRVQAREAADPSWYLGAATYLTEKLETAAVEDYTVDNEDRSPTEVAVEVLRVAGWLAS